MNAAILNNNKKKSQSKRIRDKIALPRARAHARPLNPAPCVLPWGESGSLLQRILVESENGAGKKRGKTLRISALRWQFQKSGCLTFIFFCERSEAKLWGGKIIFPLSSSVIPSVNSSAGISLLSVARWHYLLRGRWLQSATGLNSPRRRWDRGLDDILLFFFFLIYGRFASACEAESGADGRRK